MSIYITGDVHGSALNICNKINQITNPIEDDIIIICGDAGFEYEDHIMGQAKKAAKKFPGT
jgi:predicted phosphodiesterase